MLMATAVPAYAASVTQACTATAAGWSVAGDVKLYHNGEYRLAAGTNRSGNPAYPTVARSGDYWNGTWPVYTTGWTPGAAPSDWDGLDAALASRGITGYTWDMSLPTTKGFLSMDDRANTSGNNAARVITATFTYNAVAGQTYPFKLSVIYSGTSAIHAVAITASGAGVSMTPIRRYVGDKGVTDAGSFPLSDYTADGTGLKVYPVTLTATSTGVVTFTYTFSLLCPAGSMNNADIWVAAPEITGCVAAG
ncbi:hypothetical protein [Tessaracoccus palaemonis]|uniref:Uncharacterized protein n=1 Tax=Tessaracoccus palaemonis TaxID=2829499 RepID=A0ABX8SHE6_9ACTN|nr:hypothetical protein [Tessaracoccus palaemonis]QXT62811.1 hypothetical protein KDB89_13950 [Tessaracoccus palaemonis]